MNWYYSNCEKAVGPLSTFTMTELKTCGLLTDDTHVRQEGTDNWQRYEDAFQNEPGLPLSPAMSPCAESGAVRPTPSCPLTGGTWHPEDRASSGSLPRPTLGARLSTFVKAAANEAIVNTKITFLKVRIEGARLVELRNAHYALGRKLHDSHIFLGMQDEIEELDRQITENGERVTVGERETKSAKLKRIAKNAKKSVESVFLSLKIKQCLTRLGALAYAKSRGDSLSGNETELAAIRAIESRIHALAEDVRSLRAHCQSSAQWSGMRGTMRQSLGLKVVSMAIFCCGIFWIVKFSSGRKDDAVDSISPISDKSNEYPNTEKHGNNITREPYSTNVASKSQIETSPDFATGFRAGAVGSDFSRYARDQQAYEEGKMSGEECKSSPIYTEGYNKGMEEGSQHLMIKSNPYNRISQQKNWLIWNQGFEIGHTTASLLQGTSGIRN